MLLFKQNKTLLHRVMKNRKTMNYPRLMFWPPVSQRVSNPIWQLRLSTWNSQQSIPFQKEKEKQISGLILAVWWTLTVWVTCCWTNSFKGSVCKKHFGYHTKLVPTPTPNLLLMSSCRTNSWKTVRIGVWLKRMGCHSYCFINMGSGPIPMLIIFRKHLFN